MSLTIVISGIYCDPAGLPLPGYKLTFETCFNSNQTQVKTDAECVTDEYGKYSISLVPNTYRVTESMGSTRKLLGNIQIYADSVPGTLNEYLTSFQPDQQRPGVLAEMEEILEETKEAAANAGVIPRGAYSADTEYSVNDLVEFGGSEYLATADTTGVEPPSAPWELFVAAGEPGKKGDPGDKGDAGPANTLTMGTVTTLDPGEPATAAITGDAPNQTLNLSIPQGEVGPVATPKLNSPGGYIFAEAMQTCYPGDELAGSALNYSGMRMYDGELSIAFGSANPKPVGTYMCFGYILSNPETAGGCTLFARVDGIAASKDSLLVITDIVRNLAYSAADNSMIDCELFFDDAWHPFTASPNDPAWWGKAIYEAGVAGELGDVASYQG